MGVNPGSRSRSSDHETLGGFSETFTHPAATESMQLPYYHYLFCPLENKCSHLLLKLVTCLPV